MLTPNLPVSTLGAHNLRHSILASQKVTSSPTASTYLSREYLQQRFAAILSNYDTDLTFCSCFSNLLPPQRCFPLPDPQQLELEPASSSSDLVSLWSACGLLVVSLRSARGQFVVRLWSDCGQIVVMLCSVCGQIVYSGKS